MAVDQSVLLEFSARVSVQKSEPLVEAARAQGKQTAFLSHSHKDAKVAKGVQAWLKSKGWEVYIDWDDRTMPPVPDVTTAKAIQNRIVQLDWFLFLATENSTSSKWCPWEIGFADGKKGSSKIIIIPTKNNNNTYGSEYLGLYRNIESTTSGLFGVFEAGKTSGGVNLSSFKG